MKLNFVRAYEAPESATEKLLDLASVDTFWAEVWMTLLGEGESTEA